MQMTPTLSRLLSISVVAVLAVVTPTAAQDDVVYNLIELTAGGGGSTKAYALNNTGQVIGWLESEETKHAAHWHNGETTDLHGTVHLWLQHPPLFNGDYSEAYAISDADQIVGSALKEIDCLDFTTTVAHAYLLRPAVLTDLATPYPGDALTDFATFGHPCSDLDSAATAVSNANHVVGWADTDGSSTIHAFLVVPVDGQFFRDDDADYVNDLMIDLGTLPGGSDPVSSATAVNDEGRVVGYSYTTSSSNGQAAYHAFLLAPVDSDADGIGDLWFRDDDGDSANDLMVDLGTLGGTNSWARDLNNTSQIVGESDTDSAVTGGHYTHAFLWQNGSMSDLGTLGGNNSAASGINDEGAIVGWAENTDGRRRAVAWLDGEIHNLNELICTETEAGITLVPNIILTGARDINADGVICGWGTVRGSDSQQTRGFLLVPMDPDECGATDDEESTGSANGDSNSSGAGTDYEGMPIIGTPGNLGDSAPSDNSDASGSETPPATAPALCGLGGFTFLPLTLTGLCCLRAYATRRFRKTA